MTITTKSVWIQKASWLIAFIGIPDNQNSKVRITTESIDMLALSTTKWKLSIEEQT